MGRPVNNGLVELAGEKVVEKGFFCMKLVLFLNEEAQPGTPEYADLWQGRFADARQGRCYYKNRCAIYKRTIGKRIDRR